MSSLNNIMEIVTSSIDNTKEDQARDIFVLDAYNWYDTSDIAIGDGFFPQTPVDFPIDAGVSSYSLDRASALVDYNKFNEIEFGDFLVRIGFNYESSYCWIVSSTTNITWKVTCDRPELISYRLNEAQFSSPRTLNKGTNNITFTLRRGLNTLQYRRFD